MTDISEALAYIKGLTAYSLANLADTQCPDSLESEGSAFLMSVRDDVIEQIEWYNNGDYADAEDAVQLVDSLKDLDAFTNIPDEAPSIYTYTRFRQFTDLAAWQEDLEELAGDEKDMEKLAGIALYMIAERLVNGLLDAVADFEPAED